MELETRGHAQKSDMPGITTHNAGEEQERQQKVNRNNS
jgi:hypothetical protein